MKVFKKILKYYYTLYEKVTKENKTTKNNLEIQLTL